MIRFSPTLTTSAFLTALVCASPVLAGDATGTWTTEGGKSRVRITACGSNICGAIVWLQEPNTEKGTPKLDGNNPEPTKRTRPLIGLQIILPMQPDGPDRWAGSIYNPEDGKTYSASFALSGDKEANLKGCVAMILCKTQTWTRN
jgi:uncharacterized protein (DUF2147 family)